jgi:ammonia channel protein AmtB
MLASLCIFAVATIVFVIFGFSWQGAPGRSAHVIMIGGKAWNWIAAEPFFLRGLRLDSSHASLVLLLQMFSVGLAAMIPLGAGAERWKLGPASVSTILLAGWTYPLFATGCGAKAGCRNSVRCMGWDKASWTVAVLGRFKWWGD